MSVELEDVTSGYNLSRINSNFQRIEDTLNEDVVWRTGNTAGETLMERDLDMNGNAILNIGVDPSNPDSLLTVAEADARYYNITGDVLEGELDAGGFRLKGLGQAVAAGDAVRKGELDDETLARQLADANLQEQMTGNIPLEASAFSEISWHGQEIANSVTIPANKNAWSFGPQMEIDVGQLVTISPGSSWTIANGRVVEDEDLHNLIADTITTSDSSKTVNVLGIVEVARVVPIETNVSNLQTRMTAEETKVQPIALGGTGNTTGLAASATKLATARTFTTNLASTTAASFDGTANASVGVTGVLPVANGGTGAATAAAALTSLGAAANAGVTDASSAAAGIKGQMVEANASAVAVTSGTVTNLTSISLPAGEWDVYGEVQLVTSATAVLSAFTGGISTVSATDAGFPFKTQMQITSNGTVAQFPTPRRFLQTSTTTTVYLVATGVFASGTCAAAGYIHARRIR